jgi:hypothetical protein
MQLFHHTSTSGFSHSLWNAESVTLAIFILFLLHIELLPPLETREDSTFNNKKKENSVKQILFVSRARGKF